MAETRVRDRSIDFVKGIAIIAVSFAHIMPVLYSGYMDIISKFCYSFELAAFFIASGYLQFGKTERKLLDYIKHYAVSLLYPYIMFTAVLLFIDSLPSILAHGIYHYIHDFPRRISDLLTWNLGACWFFPTFFISGIIAYFCRKSSKFPHILKMIILIIIGSLMCVITEKYGYLKDVTNESIATASFWLWHLLSLISRSIVGASLVMIGYELKKFASNKAKNLSGGGSTVLVTVLVVIGFITCYMNYDFIDLHFAFIRNPILFYTSAVSTTCALLIIGKKFNPACIVWCGRESLLLILAQSGIYCTCLIITKFVNLAELPYSMVLTLAIAVLIVSLVISYFIIKLIHSTFLKILINPPKKREVR